MKDIFIDNEVAILFANTKDEHLLCLIKWLLHKDEENPENNAFLAISNSLRTEYLRSNKDSKKEFSISTIFYTLQQQGRLNGKNNYDIAAFQRTYFSKKIWKNLKSKRQNSDDTSHIALIFLSERRLALIEDNNFIHDVINFPRKGIKGKRVCAKRCPSQLNYK